MVLLPPLFLHFAFVFPERPQAWVRSEVGRPRAPVFYLPALALCARLAGPPVDAADEMARRLVLLENIELQYLSACLLGGLTLMISALSHLRSMTARRQLRWIVWGSGVGALPFVLIYAIPWLLQTSFRSASISALLLGCIPLAFASAIVRYRLMDIEVIIKSALVVSAVGLVLVVIYQGTLALVGLLRRHSRCPDNSFWALFATLIVALVAPWLWNAIQAGLIVCTTGIAMTIVARLVTLRARAEQRSRSGAPQHAAGRARDRDARGRSHGAALTDPAETGSAFVAVSSERRRRSSRCGHRPGFDARPR